MTATTLKMDKEFDSFLVDMKPFVMKLVHKTERQRCALWIKKLCEPTSLSSQDKQNRNVYAKLLLLMLKRGSLEGPFVEDPPSDGPLAPLPSYMSIFVTNPAEDENISADPPTPISKWAERELNTSFSSLNNSNPLPKDPVGSSSPNPKIPKDHNSEDVINGYNFVPDPYLRKSNGRFTSTSRDENDFLKMHERELQMKTKLLEAQFHEEKLSLQHKHDLAVQKILDRKNSEIDDLKSHYKNKEKDNEDTRKRLEKKITSLQNEIESIQSAKSKEVEDLQSLLTETTERMKADHGLQIQDLAGKMERDKYELQKSHTKNIQDLLDDTNQRLTSMEEDYNSQAQATKLVIGELENRVLQLSSEYEAVVASQQSTLMQKEELKKALEVSDISLVQTKTRLENVEKAWAATRKENEATIKSLSDKNKADAEYHKQELSSIALKNTAQVRELEDQLQAAKHALQDSDQQRVREIREKDSLHQQDTMSLQHLHNKQTHALKTDFEEERSQLQRKMRNLEEVVKDRDEQIVKLTKAQKQAVTDADQAIENFKKQASDAQQKLYDDMGSQLLKMEQDLDESHRNKTKIIDDNRLKIEEIQSKHADDILHLKNHFEQEKIKISENNVANRNSLIKEYEVQLNSAEQRLRENLNEHEKVMEGRQKQHQHTVNSFENQLRELREELVSVNASRRQQLVELGLLREEERQKMTTESQKAIAKLESEMDQQRLEQHKQHAAELERQSDKMKTKLENLESDYKLQLERALERVADAQRRETEAKEYLSHVKREHEESLLTSTQQHENEVLNLKSHFQQVSFNLQTELENERQRLTQMSRELQKSELDLKDKITHVKMQYEERLGGMLPKSVKTDFEQTISFLKSQIKSLQQKISVLDDSTSEFMSLPGPDSPLKCGS